MKFNLIDKVLSACKDYHVPACLLVFFTGVVLAIFRRLDMSFVAFTGVVVGGITGHAYSAAGKPDADSGQDDSK
jgi:hypothetical protein